MFRVISLDHAYNALEPDVFQARLSYSVKGEEKTLKDHEASTAKTTLLEKGMYHEPPYE